jgi:hypothetical protein
MIPAVTWGLYYWPFAMVIVSAVVLPAEFYALFTNPSNTLSDYCWHELDVTRALEINDHGAAWWCSIVMWGLFVAAITLHIWYRSW